MPKWEVCRIVEEYTGDYHLAKWYAIVDTLQGEKIIDETKATKGSGKPAEAKVIRDEYSKLVARLLNDGWEPMQAQLGRLPLTNPDHINHKSKIKNFHD